MTDTRLETTTIEGARPVESGGSVDADLHDELTLHNLRRVSLLALIILPVHALHIILFALKEPGSTAQAERWRMSILTAHAIMMPVAALLAVIAGRRMRTRLSRRTRSLVSKFAALSYLLFGGSLAVIDQLVTTSINPLLLTTVGIASVNLIPPRTAAILFCALLVSVWILMGWTQPDPEVLLSIRVNTISLAGLGFGISYLFWQNQMMVLKQRREIEDQKAALERKNEELAQIARRDPLTGVSNRAHLDQVADIEVSRMKRSRTETALVILDLDFFKMVNDSYGHPTGDDVLREVATVLSAQIRGADTLARLGGEEFAILLPDTSLGAAAQMAERLRGAIEAHTFTIGTTKIKLTASLGVAPLDIELDDPVDIAYRTADRMLYLAKESGRNQVRVADQAIATGEQE